MLHGSLGWAMCWYSLCRIGDQAWRGTGMSSISGRAGQGRMCAVLHIYPCSPSSPFPYLPNCSQCNYGGGGLCFPSTSGWRPQAMAMALGGKVEGSFADPNLGLCCRIRTFFARSGPFLPDPDPFCRIRIRIWIFSPRPANLTTCV
jgi:hypothetical protein